MQHLLRLQRLSMMIPCLAGLHWLRHPSEGKQTERHLRCQLPKLSYPLQRLHLLALTSSQQAARIRHPWLQFHKATAQVSMLVFQRRCILCEHLMGFSMQSSQRCRWLQWQACKQAAVMALSLVLLFIMEIKLALVQDCLRTEHMPLMMSRTVASEYGRVVVRV
jgi:hypothetical protein